MSKEEAQKLIHDDIGIRRGPQLKTVLEFLQKTLQVVKQLEEIRKENDPLEQARKINSLSSLFYLIDWQSIVRTGLVKEDRYPNNHFELRLTRKGKAFLRYLDSFPTEKLVEA